MEYCETGQWTCKPIHHNLEFANSLIELEAIMSFERRDFIKTTSLSAVGLYLARWAEGTTSAQEAASLALVKNGSPAQMARKSVELLGGMTRFVKNGQTVVIKPNMSWDRPPEMAVNTNPELVAEIVKMCGEAGASRVKVFDRTIENPNNCYLRSGIAKAASAAGADVHFVDDRQFVPVKIENGYTLKEWAFYREALEADVLINVPILKRHVITSVTMGFKNMMGLVGGARSRFHGSFDQMIVDIHRVLRPKLTILDAYCALLQNGPGGGSMAGVYKMKTVVAGTDPVMVDVAGAKLLGASVKSLPYLSLAEKAGLGTTTYPQGLPLQYSFHS